MKLYLAATAPGSDEKSKNGFHFFPYRLLSYYLIKKDIMKSNKVFNAIKKYNNGNKS